MSSLSAAAATAAAAAEAPQATAAEKDAVAFLLGCFHGLKAEHALRVLRSCHGDVSAAVETYLSLQCAQDIAKSEGRDFSDLRGSGIGIGEDDEDPEDGWEEYEIEEEEVAAAAPPSCVAPVQDSGREKVKKGKSKKHEEERPKEKEVTQVDDQTLLALFDLFPQFECEHIMCVLKQHNNALDEAIDELVELDKAIDEQTRKEQAEQLVSPKVGMVTVESANAWKKFVPQRKPVLRPKQVSPPQQEGTEYTRAEKIKLEALQAKYAQHMDNELITELFESAGRNAEHTEGSLAELFPVLASPNVNRDKQQQRQPHSKHDEKRVRSPGQHQAPAAAAARGAPKAPAAPRKKAANKPERIVDACRERKPKVQQNAVIDEMVQQEQNQIAFKAAMSQINARIFQLQREYTKCLEAAAAAHKAGNAARVAKCQKRANELRLQIVSLRDDATKRAISQAYQTGELDLHGLQARDAIMAVEYVLNSNGYQRDRLRIITGRGLHSKNGVPVLQPQVESWLMYNCPKNFQVVCKGGAFDVTRKF